MNLASMKKVKELAERRENAIASRKLAANSASPLLAYQVECLPLDLINGMMTEALTNEIVAIESELRKLGVSVGRDEPAIVDTAENWKAQAGMYDRAWQRELGTFMGVNHHKIDALVSGTSAVVREVQLFRRLTTIPAAFLKWGVEVFGSQASDPKERAMRFLEEALEVAQAFGIVRDVAAGMVERVYSREVDADKHKEIGQATATLFMLAHQASIDPLNAMEVEWQRVRSVPVEELKARHAVKVAAGLGK